MLAKIRPAKMGGEVRAIESKSYAHRILLAAALSSDQTKIEIDSLSKDIYATIGCINALGGEVALELGSLVVNPINKNQKYSVNMDCIESGSTLRFILPIISALGVNAIIDGYEGLRKRPIDELTHVLLEHGANVSAHNLPTAMSGKICGGEYIIRGDISSQYITGLMFALPLLDKDSKIIISTPIVSKKYLDITIEVLNQFGILIEEKEYGYFIKGGQKYVSPGKIKVQADWSNAAFFLALGALNGDVKMTGLLLESKQGDKEIVEVLKKMGAEVKTEKDMISVKKSKLKAITLDIQDIPDLAPIISILMAKAEGVSILKNVDRLKIKETDRLFAIMETLSKMGIESKYSDNSLKIIGGNIHKFNNISYNDHRMVMMQAIAASIADGECEIDGCEAKDKSYPQFFEDYKSLKGAVDVK